MVCIIQGKLDSPSVTSLAPHLLPEALAKAQEPCPLPCWDGIVWLIQ